MKPIPFKLDTLIVIKDLTPNQIIELVRIKINDDPAYYTFGIQFYDSKIAYFPKNPITLELELSDYPTSPDPLNNKFVHVDISDINKQIDPFAIPMIGWIRYSKTNSEKSKSSSDSQEENDDNSISIEVLVDYK